MKSSQCCLMLSISLVFPALVCGCFWSIWEESCSINSAHWPQGFCVFEREAVWVCVCVCVCEVRGGVAVCTTTVERFELQQGEGVCEPAASSCSLILPLFLFSYFLLYLPPFTPCLVSFSLVFTHTYTHNVPRLLSLSGGTRQTGKHTSPQQQQTVKEVWERERGQRRKGAPVSKCSTSSGDSTWGSSRSVCLFYAPFTRGSMYTDTQELCCRAGVFLMQINVSC